MSKPIIARFVLSLLIALALVAGIYSSAQGARLTAGAKSGQAHINSSVHPLQDPSFIQFQNFESQYEHNCNSEAYSPLDD